MGGPRLFGGGQVIVIVLSWFGIIALMSRRHPGGRDLADPALHRHADRRAGVPGDAEATHPRRARASRRILPRAKVQIDARSAADQWRPSGSTSSDEVGVLYPGSGCSRVARSSAASCSGDRGVHRREEVRHAAAFAAAAPRSPFGFMHGEQVGSRYTVGGLRPWACGGVLFALSRMPAEAAAPAMDAEPRAVPAE
jgi:hypothetical protein